MPKADARLVEGLLYALFVALLVWIPIPLGSNRSWAAALFEIWIFGLVAAWLVLWAFGQAKLPVPAVKAWPAFALLAAWVLEQALHVVPLPASLVAQLSPEAARVQGLLEGVGVSRDLMTLSVDAHASRLSLLKTLAYAGVFFLTLALVNTRVRLANLARVLVYAALLQSVYAVAMHLSGADGTFFGTRITHSAQASGTYVNRNHFAGYLEMMLALGIGMLIAGLSDRRAESWRHFLRDTLDWVLSARMVLRLALCVLVIALTTTHSRMGNTAFFASLLIAGVAGIALSRHATRNTVVLLVSLVVIDLAIVGSWFGVEKLAQRLEQTTREEIEHRETPAAYTLETVRDYPVFGAGPGSFYVAFQGYRPEVVRDFYDYAHNDYAQFAFESGILGLGLLGLLVVICLGVALRAQWVRHDPLMRGMSFASVMGVTAILIHSTADFNLQIPANAMYFVMLLGIAWITLYHDRGFGPHPGPLPEGRGGT